MCTEESTQKWVIRKKNTEPIYLRQWLQDVGNTLISLALCIMSTAALQSDSERWVLPGAVYTPHRRWGLLWKLRLSRSMEDSLAQRGESAFLTLSLKGRMTHREIPSQISSEPSALQLLSPLWVMMMFVRVDVKETCFYWTCCSFPNRRMWSRVERGKGEGDEIRWHMQFCHTGDRHSVAQRDVSSPLGDSGGFVLLASAWYWQKLRRSKPQRSLSDQLAACATDEQ